MALSDFKLCPNAHRDKGNVVSSATFLMFQYKKYMSDLVKRREAMTAVSGGSDGGLQLRIDDSEMEQILSQGAADPKNLMNNDK